MYKLVSIILSLTLISACAEEGDKQSIEIGTVNWERNYPTAIQLAKKEDKPVFLLFQEVPGCAGCQQFGRDVLSNSLIKKSIETSFIPLMIRNNAGSGHDQEILEKFKEPAWNYQVVRFINDEGEDLIARKDKVWATKPLSERMIQVLQKEQKPIPPALALAYQDSDTINHRSAAFAMACFWVGEAELGQLDGVVSTEAGWLDGREVTLVKYHKDTISLQSLVKEAQKVDCAQKVYLGEDELAKADLGRLALGKLDKSYRKAKASDQKRQLQGIITDVSAYNDAQLTKINALIRSNPDLAKQYL